MGVYSIKEAAKKLEVEAHVLRYWEDELELNIRRNEMGHRYYDDKDLLMFKSIMQLKEKGLSLKDIREAIVKQKSHQDNLHDSKEINTADENEPFEYIKDKKKETDLKIVDFKQAQLQTVMNKIVANALRENKSIITESIKSEITSDVMRQFDAVMREKEEREEARFRKIDEYMRQIQRANEEVAATKTRKRMFSRKK